MLELSNRNAYTANGALSYSTTGFNKYAKCLDYFSKCGTYLNRPQKLVDADMISIFKDDENLALAMVFGLRLITRKPELVEGINEIQTGFGRKDEFYKAVTWLAKNRPAILYDNLDLIPVFGCWKDFVTEPLIDILDRDHVYELFAINLGDNLLRKYLPQISRKPRTERDKKRIDWAKGFARFLAITDKEYRKLKSQGAAHVWQQQMSNNSWNEINFNEIPGKAMLWLSSRRGKDKKNVFERHNQVERLVKWVEKQNTIKFTGYPYELTRAAYKSKSIITDIILNKQFETVLQSFSGHKLGNVLCGLDTSGSMQTTVLPNVTAFDICLSMGLVFSSLNIGYFKDIVAGFDEESWLLKLEGNFTDRYKQITQEITAWGSTNFQSLIDLIVDVKNKNPEIPTEQFPETLLVISDMQFNPTKKQFENSNAQTNYELAMSKLNKVGLGKMRIIWWYVNGESKDFPASMDDAGVYIIGGFDPVNLKALMGLTTEKKEFVAKEKVKETPVDGMVNFFSQPIFSLLRNS